jgi:hypothetical protein
MTVKRKTSPPLFFFNIQDVSPTLSNIRPHPDWMEGCFYL